MTLPVALTSEIQKLAPSAIIELFILDATDIGGDLLRFHAGTNGLKQNIVWQGETYVRYPVAASGFEYAGQGQFPRPKLQVANIFSAITQAVLAHDDLLGAKLTRKRTMAKFLDAVNFDGGVNASADPTAEFQEEIYYVDRKSMEDRDTVEFELAASVDLVGVQIPRRQVIQNVCVWKYRGEGCGYAGPPVLDKDDQLITEASTAEGQALVDALAEYRQALDDLAALETALTTASAAKGDACDYKLAEELIEFDLDGNIVSGIRRSSLDNEDTYTARVSGSPVTLGLTYRQGRFHSSTFIHEEGLPSESISYFRIERWAADSAACTSATADYDAALAARDAQVTVVEDKLDAYNAAHAALPDDDPLYSVDRCGKRLASCKARFGENEELPFGSFPAAGLAR